jgi:hypoxanthine-DNA glycosylase
MPSPERAAPGQDGPTAPQLFGLPPVLDGRTRLLVLGSFPGEASLRAGQYYGHPRNHFWPLLCALWDIDLVNLDYAQRLGELRRRRVGLWDAYARCRRVGSLDQAIQDAQPSDLASLPRLAPALRWVAHNGAESARAMRTVQALGLHAVRLPSSSPANASWSFERKLAAWRDAFAQAGVLARAPGRPQALTGDCGAPRVVK